MSNQPNAVFLSNAYQDAEAARRICAALAVRARLEREPELAIQWTTLRSPLLRRGRGTRKTPSPSTPELLRTRPIHH
jgi:hypothetical protein